ncbi:MAG TPA: hypothetical protein VH092_30445 [Urbifossiella sp.]|jgi:hypothetical protein|nr:hypothetical protein [Urbifossiella sp.]
MSVPKQPALSPQKALFDKIEAEVKRYEVKHGKPPSHIVVSRAASSLLGVLDADDFAKSESRYATLLGGKTPEEFDGVEIFGRVKLVVMPPDHGKEFSVI